MQPVSTYFQDNITSLDRQLYGRVEFNISDTTAKSDITTVVVTDEAEFSKKAQIADNIYQSWKWATLEQDYWKLDGSFSIPPKVAETGYQIGWWSDEISDANGDFSVPQELTITFDTTHSSIGITIDFDRLAYEYAKDFDIIYYDDADNILHTENVTDNTDGRYILTQNVSDYKKIKISITSTSNPLRRARIFEIDFGIIYTYGNTDIINMNMLEELEPTSGNLASNEFKFTLDNQSQLFNILNPTGIYSYLQRKQTIRPAIGLYNDDAGFTEYVNLGVYYLQEWKDNSESLDVIFTARDVLQLLSESIYKTSVYGTQSLTDIIDDIMASAGITQYEVDSALDSINVTSFVYPCTHREALQTVAMAGNAVCYSDRDGVIQIKQLGSTASGKEILFSDAYQKPEIVLDRLINSINVNVNTYTARASSEEIAKQTINITTTVDVWVDYSSPAQNVSASASGGGNTINSATYYTNGCLLNITANGDVTITVTGKILDKTTVVANSNSIANREQEYAVNIDNNLVDSKALAQDIGAWLLDELSQNRLIYKTRYSGDPSMEAVDIVAIEDGFGIDKEVRVVRNELSFNGALNGSVTGLASV